jgi:SAM-dependent methyltransferase/GNAT superfamily N-acetyltransferase
MFVRIVEASSPEQREEVYRFRYQIYGEELGKVLGGIDHDRRCYDDNMDKHAFLLAAVDQKSGQVVGTVRNNSLADPSFPEILKEQMNLRPMLREFDPEKIGYSSAFMVDPAYRGKTVASLLFLALYRELIKRGREVELCVAEMALVNLYHQIGFRNYGTPYRSETTGGLRALLVHAAQDREYIKKVKSPIIHLMPDDVDDGGRVANKLRELYPEFSEPAMTQMERKALWAAIAHGMAGTPVSIFHGFTDDEVSKLLGAFPTVRLKAGQTLYRKGENERGMAVILSGKVGVTMDDGDSPHYVAVLGAGEVCGEMASLLRAGRTAHTMAIEDSEALLLPHNLLDKLQKKDMEAALRVSRNLNCLLSMRLEATTDQVVSLHSQVEAGERPVREQGGTALKKATLAQESYSIVTLDDPNAELARLEAQARVGWGVELHWLRRAGFKDHSTYLDLGSGPGVTSFMLAQTFPRSKVIGVEPEAMLRERARERAEENGIQDRCEFIAGMGQEIPLPDDSVDFCYARFVMQHVPDPIPIFRELRRVTRPGGVVVVADVDDEGVVVYPEPEGLRDFQIRSSQAQRGLGGDRSVGRKLMAHMHAAGFAAPFTEVAPVTSHDLPKSLLVNIAFSFKEQTLKRAELWKDGPDDDVLRAMSGVAEDPDGWMLIPVFFSHGIA